MFDSGQKKQEVVQHKPLPIVKEWHRKVEDGKATAEVIEKEVQKNMTETQVFPSIEE